MSTILDLIGRNFAEPEVAKRLSDYPGLRPEDGGAVSEERVQPVKYLRSTADGLLIKMSDEGMILAIFLMSDGKDGSREYRGELPGRLNFAAEPADAIRAFGPPATYGGRPLGEFLRYDWPTYSLHLQFRPDEDGLDLVTAMVAKEVPGRRQG